jgi:UDP-N-acetylmuramate-alanine ligase
MKLSQRKVIESKWQCCLAGTVGSLTTSTLIGWSQRMLLNPTNLVEGRRNMLGQISVIGFGRTVVEHRLCNCPCRVAEEG